MTERTYQKIVVPTRMHPDTLTAIFLLKKFGKDKYPGIEKAKVEIWPEIPKEETPQSLDKKGYFLLDVGGGKLDHHFKKTTASRLVAEDLAIVEDPALAKLLVYTERDDQYGMGTVSNDPIDRAFGLSGLISNLNKFAAEKPQAIVEIIIPLIHAHYQEEKNRVSELPREFKEKLEKKQAELFELKQGKKKLKIVMVESGSPSLAGWLRSAIGEKADVVIQKNPSGHINIMTRPLKKIDLRWLIAYLRKEEADLRNRRVRLSAFQLMKPGRIQEIPEWYYDLAATNSLLNGSQVHKNVPPTIIDWLKIKQLAKEALSIEPPK